jgi:hypothetical protein
MKRQTEIIKKPIYASNLMLRFYEKDGWTKSELDSCCLVGSVKCFFPKDPEPYFTLDQGSSFNITKLYEHCSHLFRSYKDHEKESDIQYLERMNG